MSDSVAYQRGGYTPPINPGELFTDVMANASRLITLCGLENLVLTIL